jgi:hypothetical protein
LFVCKRKSGDASAEWGLRGEQLQEKAELLRELEGEGERLCRRVQELLEAEGDQRERASRLAGALETERKERQALEEHLQESKTLLAAQQTQLRQLHQVYPPAGLPCLPCFSACFRVFFPPLDAVLSLDLSSAVADAVPHCARL